MIQAKFFSLKDDVIGLVTEPPKATFMGTGITFIDFRRDQVIPKGTIISIIKFNREVDRVMPYRIDADELRWLNEVEAIDIRTNNRYSFKFEGKFEFLLEEVPEETVKVLYGG